MEPLPAAPPELTIAVSPLKALSPAQLEFNKRMKALERARKADEKKRTKLDEELRVCREELMPLVEKVNRAELNLVSGAAEARASTKLTKRRNKWLGDLISGKAADLLGDPTGLSEADIGQLEAMIEELGTSESEKEREEMEGEEFDAARGMLEEMARSMGVDLDLNGLDVNGDPEAFERELEKRLTAAEGGFQKAIEKDAAKPKRKRKPTKAAMERERKQQAVEEAKKRDLKTLYKQLAKVLHPDLEPDPKLKPHREVWMKRLTTARKEGDLREMLAIELEWLGEETGNLAKASDEKLEIYSMVLKEQAKEQREKTKWLEEEPQYQPLYRFRGPFGERRRPADLKAALRNEKERLEEMVGILRSGGKQTKEMLNAWADAHARQYAGR